MIKFLISLFDKIAQKEHSEWHRLAIFFATIGFVFLFFPIFYIFTGEYIESIMGLPTIANYVTIIIAVPFLILGGILLIWSLVMQYSYGGGSGSHIIPTQKLIITGPYKITRHPMLLGSILFYFGICTILSSLIIGLYAGITTAVLAYLFARYIEEPGLIIRFGERYKAYQRKVPFIPCSPACLYHCNGKHESKN